VEYTEYTKEDESSSDREWSSNSLKMFIANLDTESLKALYSRILILLKCSCKIIGAR
jgi:hypothetical protein